MQDIDPQLRRLRDLESRIALFETRIAQLLGRMQTLESHGVDSPTWLETYEIRLQVLATLRARRDAFHAELEPTQAPAATPAVPTASSNYRLLAARPVRAHRMGTAELRRATLLFVDAALESFERAGSAPDAWESTHLARSLGFVCAGMFFAAISHVEIALTDPTNRGLHPPLSRRAAPVSLAWLRATLDQLWKPPAAKMSGAT